MHLLSDCRQNNNLTKGSGLCKEGWPVNMKPGGGKRLVEEGRKQGGVEWGNWRGVHGSIKVRVRLREVCEARSHNS